MTDTNNGWQPIDTAEIHAFDAECWWASGDYVLVWDRGIFVAWYGHTLAGKGRWMAGSEVVQPTHWMPLPAPPIPEPTPYLQALLDEKDIEI